MHSGEVTEVDPFEKLRFEASNVAGKLPGVRKLFERPEQCVHAVHNRLAGLRTSRGNRVHVHGVAVAEERGEALLQGCIDGACAARKLLAVH